MLGAGGVPGVKLALNHRKADLDINLLEVDPLLLVRVIRLSRHDGRILGRDVDRSKLVLMESQALKNGGKERSGERDL